MRIKKPFFLLSKAQRLKYKDYFSLLNSVQRLQYKDFFFIEWCLKIKNLITYLIDLLKTQNESFNLNIIQSKFFFNIFNNEKDLMKILFTKINSANIVNYN